MGASATTGSYTPADSGIKLVIEAWQKTIEDAVYEDARLYPVAVERDRLYNKLHIRKFSTFSASTLAQSYPSNPTSTFVNYSANTETEVTISPTAIYIALSVSENQLAQMDQSPMRQWRNNVENGLAQSIDTTFGANASSFTTNSVGDGTEDLTKASCLSAMTKLRTSAKSAWNPGMGKPAYLAFHPAQFDNFMSIPEVTAANLRGDEANPNVKGMSFDSWGLRVIISGDVLVDGSAVAWNMLFLPETIGISFNEKTTIKTQDFEFQNRLFAYANFGTAIVWDERGVPIKTPSV